MTALQLRAELLQTLNPIFDDVSLMREVIDFVKKLSFKKRESIAKQVEFQYDTDEEIENGLRQAFQEFKEYKEGKRTFKTADEFLKELEEV